MKKPLLAQTLAWIAAVVVACLFAYAGPDGADRLLRDGVPQGADTPR